MVVGTVYVMPSYIDHLRAPPCDWIGVKGDGFSTAGEKSFDPNLDLIKDRNWLRMDQIWINFLIPECYVDMAAAQNARS